MIFPETNSLSSKAQQHCKIDKCVICYKIYQCQLFLIKRHLYGVHMITSQAFTSEHFLRLMTAVKTGQILSLLHHLRYQGSRIMM